MTESKGPEHDEDENQLEKEQEEKSEEIERDTTNQVF
jgi:hypothetical protein